MSHTHMARIFITGSTDGLGLAAARALIEDGHQVVLHARNGERAASLTDLAGQAAGIVVGDLGSDEETRSLAEQVNAIGRTDAVIHNAGVYADSQRFPAADGHARTIAVNILAPYLLTCLIQRPGRLVYLTSGMHRSGDPSLRGIDWSTRRWNGVQAYCDSKLYVTALAYAVARRWHDVRSNAVDPGWVPTRMGGSGAPDDLTLGYLTQVWLATSDEPEARASGAYWYHRRRQTPAATVRSERFQEALLDELAQLTGLQLP
jgi:NAD(P)-dependent dehydrogenase (short-subunit alcohol dehydrogenase family)